MLLEEEAEQDSVEVDISETVNGTVSKQKK